EFDLSVDDELFRSSINYAAKYQNEDGTITISHPKFSNPTGNGAKFIATGSSLDGVCKLYGLGTVVYNALLDDYGHMNSNVKINDQGQFAGYADHPAITKISCVSLTPLP